MVADVVVFAEGALVGFLGVVFLEVLINPCGLGDSKTLRSITDFAPTPLLNFTLSELL